MAGKQRNVELEDALTEALMDANLRRALKKIVEREKELRKQWPDKPEWWVWKISEVGLTWHIVQKLMLLGIVKNVYSSSRNKYYRLVDFDLTVEALASYEEKHTATQQPTVQAACSPVPYSPDELFDIVVGHDDYKWLIWKALRKWEQGSKPAHFLLIGPPASGKTMFLESIERKIGCVEYIAAENARRGGFTDRLYKAYQLWGKRFILLLDEIDKMDHEALKTVYNLMEGRLDLAIRGKHVKDKDVAIMVLATSNSLRGIPEAIRSRFGQPLVFEKYSRDMYIRVVKHALPMLEGISPDLANYIAVKTAEAGVRDPRTARQIARMVDSKEDVDRVLKIMLKNRFSR